MKSSLGVSPGYAPKVVSQGESKLRSSSPETAACAQGLAVFRELWESAHPEIAVALREMSQDPGLSSFVAHSFDGREDYPSDPKFFKREVSPTFRNRMEFVFERLGQLFDEWSVRCIFNLETPEPSNVPLSESQRRSLLVLEGLLNATLLRWHDPEDPAAGFAAMVVYAGAPLIWESARFQMIADASGILLHWKSQDTSTKESQSRTFFLTERRAFEFVGPFVAPSSYLFGMAPRDGLLSLVCPFLPEQKRLPVDETHTSRWLVRVRLIQREACLVTEEWEFRNAVLAVEFMAAKMKTINAAPSASFSSTSSAGESSKVSFCDGEEDLARVLKRRDQLALWFAATLADLNRVLVDLKREVPQATTGALSKTLSNAHQPLHGPDLLLEIDAARLALLAALQKLYLPASVSRHDYDPCVFVHALRFAKDQVRWDSHDVAAQVSILALESALLRMDPTIGNDALLDQRCKELAEFLQERPTLDWVLSFDPSPTLKAVSWLLPPGRYLALVLCLGLALSRKLLRQGARLDANWSAVLVSLLQMPETFPVIRFTDLERRFEKMPPHFQDGFWKDLSLQVPSWLSQGAAEGMAESYSECWMDLIRERLQLEMGEDGGGT